MNDNERETIKAMCKTLISAVDDIDGEPNEIIKSFMAIQLAEIVAVTRKTYGITSGFYAPAEFEMYKKHGLSIYD